MTLRTACRMSLWLGVLSVLAILAAHLALPGHLSRRSGCVAGMERSTRVVPDHHYVSRVRIDCGMEGAGIRSLTSSRTTFDGFRGRASGAGSASRRKISGRLTRESMTCSGCAIIRPGRRTSG